MYIFISQYIPIFLSLVSLSYCNTASGYDDLRRWSPNLAPWRFLGGSDMGITGDPPRIKHGNGKGTIEIGDVPS